MVKVSAPPSAHLGVANTSWQLEDILANTAEAHPVVHVEESEFQLPTMLITTSMMDLVHEAIKEHAKTGEPISKCIRLDLMDQHMSGSMKKVSFYYGVVRWVPGSRRTYLLVLGVCSFFTHQQRVECQLRRLLV